MSKSDYEMEDFFSKIECDEEGHINVYVADECEFAPAKKKTSEIICWLVYGIVAIAVSFGCLELCERYNNQEKKAQEKNLVSMESKEEAYIASNLEIDENYETIESESVKTGAVNIADSTGTIEKDGYRNDWLEFKFKVPADYKIYPKEEYVDYSDQYNECIFYAMNQKGDSVICQVTDYKEMYGKSSMTEMDFLKALAEDYQGEDIEAVNIGNCEKINIAGQTYYSMHYALTVDAEYYVQSMYARNVEGKMSVIIVTGVQSNKDKNNGIVELFERE